MKSGDHLFNLAVTCIGARDDKRRGETASDLGFGFINSEAALELHVNAVKQPKAIKRELGRSYVHQREVALQRPRGAFVDEQPSHCELAAAVAHRQRHMAPDCKAAPRRERLRALD